MARPPKIVPFHPMMNAATVVRRIRELAADSANVFPSPHAKKRMRERRVSLPHVLEVLRKGNVVEQPHLNTHQNWECTFERPVAGDDLRVVAAIEEVEVETAEGKLEKEIVIVVTVVVL